MSYCSLCTMNLGEIDNSRRWVHDIVFHQEYSEEQLIQLTREQIIDILINITKMFYFDEA